MKRRLLPPRYFNVLLVLAVGSHLILPIKRLIYAPYSYVGIVFVLAGIVLNVRSVALLKRHNTTIDFHGTPNELVIDGPFRLSRNPIYLSGVTLSLGISIALGSLITFVLPIALLTILNHFYIPSEEAELEKAFGEEYLRYKQRVRRWI